MDRKKKITPITNADYQAVINNSVQGAGSRLVGSAAEQKKMFVRPIANTDGSPNVMDYIKRLVTELAEVIAEGDLAVDELAGVVDNATKELETKLTMTNKPNKLYGTDKYGRSTVYELDEVGDIVGVDLGFEIVRELPEVGATNVLYFIPIDDAEDDNLFEEWVWLNKGTEEEPNFGWERIGSKKVTIDHSEYVKFTDYATTSKAGVSKFLSTRGIGINANGEAYIERADKSLIEGKSNPYRPIVPANQDLAWKVSATTNTEEWTDEDKAKACETIGAVKKVANTGSMNVVYGEEHSGKGSKMFTLASGGTGADTIPMRNANGQFDVRDPQGDLNVVNKRFAEANFVAIPNTTAYGSYVIQYVVTENGKVGVIGEPIKVQGSAGANTIPLRGVGGVVKVGDAVDDTDAPNLGQVKNGFVAKPTNIEEKSAACKAIGAVQSLGAGGSFVYGADIYGDTIIQFSTYALEDRLAQRDGDGVLHGNAPTTDTGLVNKRFAEANFVAIPNTTAYGSYVIQYVVTENGKVGVIGEPIKVQGSAGANTIPLRGVGGVVKVGDAVDDTDAPNLGQVKNGFVAKPTNIEEKSAACKAIGAVQSLGAGGSFVYGADIYGDTIIQFSTYALEDRLAQRDGDGVLHGNAPTTDTGLVNKQYAEANFAPRISNVQGALRMWVSNGVAGYWADTQSNAASAAPNRYAMYLPETDGDSAVSGYMLTNIPTRPYQSANKKYVDDAIANISVSGGGGGGTKLYLHKIYCTFTNGDETVGGYLSIINAYSGAYNEYTLLANTLLIHNGHLPLALKYYYYDADGVLYGDVPLGYLVYDDEIYFGTFNGDGIYYIKVSSISENPGEIIEL